LKSFYFICWATYDNLVRQRKRRREKEGTEEREKRTRERRRRKERRQGGREKKRGKKERELKLKCCNLFEVTKAMQIKRLQKLTP